MKRRPLLLCLMLTLPACYQMQAQRRADELSAIAARFVDRPEREVVLEFGPPTHRRAEGPFTYLVYEIEYGTRAGGYASPSGAVAGRAVEQFDVVTFTLDNETGQVVRYDVRTQR